MRIRKSAWDRKPNLAQIVIEAQPSVGKNYHGRLRTHKYQRKVLGGRAAPHNAKKKRELFCCPICSCRATYVSALTNSRPLETALPALTSVDTFHLRWARRAPCPATYDYPHHPFRNACFLQVTAWSQVVFRHREPSSMLFDLRLTLNAADL
jgi:hypothetical protein